MPTVESLVDTSGTPHVRGMLHLPSAPSGAGLVLTHGAGGNRDAPLLVALSEALVDSGMAVLRCDLPFRQLRPHGPPHGSDVEDRAGLRRALEVLRPHAPKHIFLGGQSYGGRQASMLLAEEPGLANGLLLLSYPLHPPGKPAQLRTKHLPNIQCPCLFISGTKDPFGSPDEIRSAITLVPGHTSLLLIDGAGHDLGYGRRVSKKMADFPDLITQALIRTFGMDI